MAVQWAPPAESGVPLSRYHPVGGDHLCSLWTDPQRDRQAAARFLAGCAEGEQAFWIQDALRAGLPAEGEADRYTTDGVHVRGAVFLPGRMRAFWRDETLRRRDTGARHVRAVAEMTWALRGLPGTEELPVFESSLNPALTSLPLSVICQYGSSGFAPETVLAVVLSHPLVVIGEQVYPNPFYVPDDRFSERFARLRADPVSALVPVWTHFLHRQPSAEALAAFACNSLPTLLGATRVWVGLREVEATLALDVERDRLERVGPADLPVLEQRGRLHALWPSIGRRPGGAVHSGTVGGLAALEATLEEARARVVVARPHFGGGDVALFVTLGVTLAQALGASAEP